ncbi:MAG TPA: hypothetical protein VG755_32570 [Nannocystaceae bacterium]|nr:hypothetical protein [Nannocystaceae bacterium]
MRPLALACSVILLLGSCGNGDDEADSDSGDSEGNPPFACGSTLMCRAAEEYCEVVLAPDMTPASYHCVELPMECGNSPECECLEMTTCGECTVSTEGGLTSSCVPD